MTEMFEDQLLQAFMQTFYGYGSYCGAYWFIGMEEGGGGSFYDIANRLDCWCKRGQQELEDVAEYHTALGITRLFAEYAKLQPTWNKLIRILLSAEGQVVTTEQVRSYQARLLGRSNGNSCLLELLPLPSPSVNHWLYGQHSQLTYLADRSMYTNHCAEPRATHIKGRIEAYKPKAVIFYGLNYKPWWERIAGVPFSITADGFYFGSNTHTVFAIAKHPTTIGVTNDYFHRIGKLIAADFPPSKNSSTS
jgi:hypothetical protein